MRSSVWAVTRGSMANSGFGRARRLLGEGPVGQRPHGVGLHVQPGEGVAEHAVVGQARGPAHLGQRAERPFDGEQAGDPAHRPQPRPDRLQHRPALVALADDLLGLDHHVVEHQPRAPSRRAAARPRRARSTATRATASRRRPPASAVHAAQAAVGVGRARRGHRRAECESPPSCSAMRAAARAADGGPAGPSAASAPSASSTATHQLVSPRRVAGSQSSCWAPTPWSASVGRADLEALGVGGAGHAPTRQLLEVDHLLDGRRVPSAQLGRPAGDEPAGVEQRALPVACPARDVPR